MTFYFDHEKLDAYRFALEFTAWTTDIIERLPTKVAARDQLDRATTSAVNNICEGNGKFALRDRRRYFDIALGSELECAGCLDVLYVRRKISEEELETGKRLLQRAVSTLIGLIRSVDRRIGEDGPVYYVDSDAEGFVPQ